MQYCILALALGCGPAGSTNSTTMPPGDSASHDHDGHAHDSHAQGDAAHATHGPHHGVIVELGNEEYHAEIVHDDMSLTVYILDSAAKQAIPIDASDVLINLMRDGKPEQIAIPAKPDAGDSAGKSSRFQLDDAELIHAFDQENASPRLSLTIAGTAYRGSINHVHDTAHDPHDHDADHSHTHE